MIAASKSHTASPLLSSGTPAAWLCAVMTCKYHDLRIEMARQCRSLMKHAQGSNREINRQKNFLNI
jgi:hypothetical protein